MLERTGRDWEREGNLRAQPGISRTWLKNGLRLADIYCMACPYCSSPVVFRSRRRGADRILSLFGQWPYRCLQCQGRFFLPMRNLLPHEDDVHAFVQLRRLGAAIEADRCSTPSSPAASAAAAAASAGRASSTPVSHE